MNTLQLASVAYSAQQTVINAYGGKLPDWADLPEDGKVDAMAKVEAIINGKPFPPLDSKTPKPETIGHEVFVTVVREARFYLR